MKTKKKVFTAIWNYIRPEFGIYLCWLTLFRLIIQRANLDSGRLNLDGGTLVLDWGTLTFDGGTRPPTSPLHFKYCLSVNLGEKSVLFLVKTFFFWSSPEFGKKKCSICIFSLVFTKFPHLNKIVVEVHPPNVENRAKLG